MIAEIQKRAFDERTITKTTYYPESLTIADSLGPDAGEFFITQFDDVDDFHNYHVTDESTRLGEYKLGVKVGYINSLTPDSLTLNRTFSKRIRVKVSSAFLHTPLEFNHVIGY